MNKKYNNNNIIFASRAYFLQYEYPNLMLLDLESQASSYYCKYTCIIENRQQGTSVPDDMEQAHIKMTGQTDNEHLNISFIYHWYSFLL
jgi:hypothetical protein